MEMEMTENYALSDANWVKMEADPTGEAEEAGESQKFRPLAKSTCTGGRKMGGKVLRYK